MLWSTTCLLQSASIHPEPQPQGEGSREVFYCFWLFAFPLSYIPWLYKRLLKSLHVIWTDPKSFHDRQDKLGKAFYGAVLRTKPLWSYGQHVFSCFFWRLLPTSKTPNVTCWSWTYHLFHESFWAVFILTFFRTLHGHCVAGFIQLNSKEHKDAKGHMAQGVSPVSWGRQRLDLLSTVVSAWRADTKAKLQVWKVFIVTGGFVAMSIELSFCARLFSVQSFEFHDVIPPTTKGLRPNPLGYENPKV